MTKVVEITADDLRQASLKAGIDPDRWDYVWEDGKGYHIRRGIFIVGTLLFEDMAKILVDHLNKENTQ